MRPTLEFRQSAFVKEKFCQKPFNQDSNQVFTASQDIRLHLLDHPDPSGLHLLQPSRRH